MIDNKELAAYIRRRVRDWKKVVPWTPTENEIEFWIQQFKTKDCCGHSEWSERYHKNIWIKDKET